MNTKKQVQSKSKLDVMLWIVNLLLLSGGIVANFYFINYPLSVRLIGWLVLVIVIGFVALQTALGKTSWNFIQDAKLELRKVVWPTRQETVQTTMIVLGMVLLTALILWGVDSVLIWLIGFLTGQRG